MLEGVEDEVAECLSSKNHSVEWIISKQASARILSPNANTNPLDARALEVLDSSQDQSSD